MVKQSYSEKLRNPKWQKKRLEIFNRDNFTCCMCGDKETELHVHHKSYEYGRDPHDYPDENFQTLCKHCHRIIEFFKNEFGSSGEVIKIAFYDYFVDVRYYYVLVSGTHVFDVVVDITEVKYKGIISIGDFKILKKMFE